MTYAEWSLVPERQRSAKIWEALTADHDTSYPEGRAAFDDDLREFLATIERRVLRDHYTAFFREKRREIYFPPITRLEIDDDDYMEV